MQIRNSNSNSALISCKMTAIGVCGIRTATERHDSWIRHLSRIFSNQIGFINDTARRQRIENGNYKIIEINSQPIGFMCHSNGIRKHTHLAQIAISEEAWKNGIADYSIDTLLQLCTTATHKGLSANVRSDLRLNGVARRMGASLVETDLSTTARGKHINKYFWSPTNQLFSNPPS